MLTNFNDIKTDVIVKLDIATTSAFYTDAILNDWIQQAERWATSYRKWAFTEGRVSTTYTTANEEWNFEGYKADSFRMLQIGGKLIDKRNFEDYQLFREKRPDDTKRIYSDYGRTVFINPKIDLSGTLTAYGQFTPVPIDVTDLSSETIFSNGDEEGNTAIVEEVLSYAKVRDQNAGESKFHHERAIAILDGVFGNIEDEQYNYKTDDTRDGLFKQIDVVEGAYSDDLFKRNQFT